MTGRAARLALAGACAGVLVVGPPRGTSAAFTAQLAVAGNGVTADKLGNYFQVTPGSAVQPGTSTPIATGAPSRACSPSRTSARRRRPRS